MESNLSQLTDDGHYNINSANIFLELINSDEFKKLMKNSCGYYNQLLFNILTQTNYSKPSQI